MEELFVMKSEIHCFRNRNPKYNEFELIYDEFGESIGYIARYNPNNKEVKFFKHKK